MVDMNVIQSLDDSTTQSMYISEVLWSDSETYLPYQDEQ